MTKLLGALLRNESGGRNIANTHEGTSSGQAQGYFQITTGTWKDFGGGKYASNPLGASYDQQAEIAAKIPLKRWDSSTLAAMRNTGLPIDPNRTLGENLAMHGEGFGGGARDGGQGAAPAQQAQPQQAPAPPPAPPVMDGPRGQEQVQPAGYSTRPQGPVEAAGGGRGSDPRSMLASLIGGGNSANPGGPVEAAGGGAGNEAGAGATAPVGGAAATPWWQTLAKNLGGVGESMGGGGMPQPASGAPAQPGPARIDQGAVATVDPAQQDQQRQQLAMAMQRLNSGRLF
jgi:hypothetical protein